MNTLRVFFENVLILILYASTIGGFLVPVMLVVCKLVSWRTPVYDEVMERAFVLLFYFSFYGFIVAASLLTAEKLLRYFLWN